MRANGVRPYIMGDCGVARFVWCGGAGCEDCGVRWDFKVRWDCMRTEFAPTLWGNCGIAGRGGVAGCEFAGVAGRARNACPYEGLLYLADDRGGRPYVWDLRRGGIMRANAVRPYVVWNCGVRGGLRSARRAHNARPYEGLLYLADDRGGRPYVWGLRRGGIMQANAVRPYIMGDCGFAVGLRCAVGLQGCGVQDVRAPRAPTLWRFA